MGLDVVPATFVAHPTTKAWAGPTGTDAHPAGEVRCFAPGNETSPTVGRLLLQISPNAQQFSAGVAYTYHDVPAVVGLSPSSGPLDGGTRVVVSGAALTLGVHYVCRFNETTVPAALGASTLADYVAWSTRQGIDEVTSAKRDLGVRAKVAGTVDTPLPAACEEYHSDGHYRHSEESRVAGALAECGAHPSCEWVYYNECDASPPPLYLCPSPFPKL